MEVASGGDVSARELVSEVVLLFVVAAGPVAWAQQGGTGSISGRVCDPQQAAVSAARVTLTDLATSGSRTVNTNEAGYYFFGNLLAGVYEISVEAAGFNRALASPVKLDAATEATQHFTLRVEPLQTVISVAGTTESPLETEDASIGTVIPSEAILRLPNYWRQVNYLLNWQAGVAAVYGQVTGARSDQLAIQLDGADVSDTYMGVTTRVVVPAESTEEARFVVANPGASLGRASGGQVVMQTKRGSNTLHGSAYGYLQNEALNANTWDDNRLGIPRQRWRENRFGATVGGPIVRNHTFFFLHYEAERLAGPLLASKLVPTDSLRQGLLRFSDASGQVRTIDPAAYDPSGLGANPAVTQFLQRYPRGNDPSVAGADGLNTTGLSFVTQDPSRNDFGLLRLDHAINQSWTLDASARYNRYWALNGGGPQIDLINRKLTGEQSTQPRYVTGAATGVLTPHHQPDAVQLDSNHVDTQPPTPGRDSPIQHAGRPSGDLSGRTRYPRLPG